MKTFYNSMFVLNIVRVTLSNFRFLLDFIWFD